MAGQIPGYDYGRAPQAPFTLDDLELLKKTVMWTEEDERLRRRLGEVLKDKVERILDLWYGWVGSNPHLVYYFSDPEGKAPIKEYLEAVRRRFGQWILDLCFRPLDQEWLNYQHEIGLRHHRAKKGATDGVRTVPHIPLRYMIAFIYPITATIRPFIEEAVRDRAEVDRLMQTWFKLVVLSVVLWSYPYANKGDW